MASPSSSIVITEDASPSIVSVRTASTFLFCLSDISERLYKDDLNDTRCIACYSAEPQSIEQEMHARLLEGCVYLNALLDQGYRIQNAKAIVKVFYRNGFKNFILH